MVKDFLWPVGTAKTLGKETDWWVLLGMGHDFDNTDPDSRYRTWILPVLFYGRDRAHSPYAAVFPIGGSIHEFLGRDTISFVLFPLYSRSTLNDLKTWNVLWPLISHTTGDGVDRFRVFPLYGRSVREGESCKRFVLWPFWTSASYEAPGRSGTAWVLFPVAGRVNMENQKSWMILPPLFRFSTSTEINRGYCPWPFIQYSSGTEDKFYLWPLWGHKDSANARYRFALWPIYSSREQRRNHETVRRTFVAPLLYRETRDGRDDQGQPLNYRYWKLWPLVSYERDRDRVATRLLELWPTKYTAQIERNYAPFWSLYAHRRQGQAVEDEALWGLWRRRSLESGDRRAALFPIIEWQYSAESRSVEEWSLLKGLVGFRRDGRSATYRVLYVMRFGGGKP